MKIRSGSFLPAVAIYLTLAVWTPARAQDLPEQMYFTEDGRRLKTGGADIDGFYQLDEVLDLHLDFHDPDFWQFMIDNFGTDQYALATLTYDGEELDSVAVAFKGQTSYQKAVQRESEKLSFSVKLDEYIEGQDLDGYNNLNLNNAFEDNSFMREVLYGTLSGWAVPALKGNYVRLWLNGEDWGIYPNIQQLNGDFIGDWYPDNDGIRWRADSPENDLPLQTNEVENIMEPPPGGGGPGGGGKWGDGTAALNYHGEDTSSYQPYYTLKDTDLEDPWPYLVRACRVLNETPLETLKDSLAPYMDMDATLWFLAQEVLFSDDDSYVYKGKMDYYLFVDEATGRMRPLEFDGNSVMKLTNQEWSPFMNEDDVNYPLMNRLLAVPELRQRYIAHAKAFLDVSFVSAENGPVIDRLDGMIRELVINDPKSAVTATSYDTDVDRLRTFLNSRRNVVLSHEEFQEEGPIISEPVQWVDGQEDLLPESGESCTITVSATHDEGIAGMRLYAGTGLTGHFELLEMRDDGLEADALAGDGLFSATIPAQEAGTVVRYYIEALAGNAAHTAAYMPKGAEYDVFAYRVNAGASEVEGLVINELLASNDRIMADEAGEFDDWVEIHNASSLDMHLEGYTLSDDFFDPHKWMFPDTVIGPGEYLVVWTDDDTEQGPMHASFKLSAGGEEVILSDLMGQIIDQTAYHTQSADISFGRWPDATGDFLSMEPTFQAPNSWQLTASPERESEADFLVYPNPCRDVVYIKGKDKEDGILTITNTMGQVVLEEVIRESMDVSTLPAGMYILRFEAHSTLLQKY